MTALAGTAAADATDDYPIPKRIWQTPCDAEQVLQGVATRRRCITSGT